MRSRRHALTILKIARRILTGDFTDDFDTNDALPPDTGVGDDLDLDVGEESLFTDTKNDRLPSPAQRDHWIPDRLRTVPTLIDLIKKGRG